MLRAVLSLRKYALICSVLVLTACVANAQTDSAHHVHFARGQSSTRIEGAVVRGTRDRYLVDARFGQRITVIMSSLENNAAFSVTEPDGKFLPGATDESDATHWSGNLPASGAFMINVGGTRGNAKYVLSVTIK